MSEARIKALRREYAEIHRQVLASHRQAGDANLSQFQRREQEIVSELRSLGASVYEAAT
jgi:hypothetical protein